MLRINKYGAVVSLGKDSEEKAFIPGWSNRNTKFQGNFLTTTQGVELALRDLVTFCVDPSQAKQPKGFKFVGCNVTVLKHADEKVPNMTRSLHHAVHFMSKGLFRSLTMLRCCPRTIRRPEPPFTPPTR